MKLKNCPFCSSKDLEVVSNEGLFGIACLRCGCRQTDIYYTSKQKAIIAWNTRPSEQELLEALKGIMQADETFKKALSNGDFINAQILAIETDDARIKAKQLIEKYEVKG